MPNFLPMNFVYHGLQSVETKAWTCGYCSAYVSSDKGYQIRDPGGNPDGGVYVCPQCKGATFFPPQSDLVIPAHALGQPVAHVPDEVNAVYEEARRCTGQHCDTGAVLLCRKVLMNLAVDRGADPGGTFLGYVEYLSENGYVPPNGKAWVDYIRSKGNEATHEIPQVDRVDAARLLTFTEMLLKFAYEFPASVPKSPVTSAAQPDVEDEHDDRV